MPLFFVLIFHVGDVFEMVVSGFLRGTGTGRNVETGTETM